MKRIVAALLALILALSIQWSALAAGQKYVVTASSLNVRKSASTSSAKVMTLKKGATVTVVGSVKDYYKISVNGKTGFVAKKYVKKASSSSSSASKSSSVTKLSSRPGYLKAKSTLYASASTSAKKVTTLAKGSKVSVIGQIGSWFQVKNGSGKTGYVKKSVISQSTSSSGKTPQSAKAPSSSISSVQSRLQKLGYLSSGQMTGKLDANTKKALKHFQMQAGLALSGKADASTVKKLNTAAAPKKKDIVTMDWFSSGINKSFSRGSTATIIDCNTGTRIRIRRVYGTNHADVEPATANDTAKLKRIYGGTWSWNTRAVILVVGGRYVAASINGMPHGDGISKTNNFNGQFCLHTSGSKTHANDSSSKDHQSKVSAASRYLK